MRKRTTWLATFNGATAHIYRCDVPAGKIFLVENEEGPHKPAFADHPGKVYESASSARSAAEPHTDPERALEDSFVGKVVEKLAAQARAGLFDQLIVAAGPRALGAFRKVAPKDLSAKVISELDKDYTSSNAEELERIIFGASKP
jgi:protein required for attachment to host cells